MEQRYSGESNIEDIARAWARGFASSIMDAVIGPLLEIFSPKQKIDMTLKESLNDIATKAYIWSHTVNTNFSQCDFHPFIFQPGDMFDPKQMKRDGAPRDKTTKGRIIGCVGMGLRTSVSKGRNCGLEEALQLPVPIVTEADI
jgi:hypothetical protein